jgi:integrase
MASSAQAKFSKIVSFFNFNHIRLKIARFPRVTDDQYRGPKRLQKEEILKMISLCEGHRDKLLLMIGAESGLRVRALSVLKLNHLVSSEDGSDEGVPTTSLRNLYSATIPCRIQLPKRFYLGKKREGIAFLCRDAVETLARYLEERRARGEPITGDTPLLPTYKAIFRMVDNNARVAGNIRDWHAVGTRIMLHQRRPPGPKGDLTAVEAEILEIEVAPVSASFLEKTMQRLRTLAEITYDPKKERPCSCHSLRKYLHCTLDVGGVNANMVNVIIGHANSISDHYSGKKYLDLEEIRHAYSSAIHRITITGKTNLRQLSDLEERIKLLEGENENLKRQLAHFRGVSQAENERATENLAN